MFCKCFRYCFFFFCKMRVGHLCLIKRKCVKYIISKLFWQTWTRILQCCQMYKSLFTVKVNICLWLFYSVSIKNLFVFSTFEKCILVKQYLSYKEVGLFYSFVWSSIHKLQINFSVKLVWNLPIPVWKIIFNLEINEMSNSSTNNT